MCSTSQISLPPASESHPVPSFPAHVIRQNRSQYCLVDIREASEESLEEADLRIPMGALLHDPTPITSKEQTVVLVCNTGARATLAASALGVSVLQGGAQGWKHAAAVRPDFVVVLGVKSTEKLSLALAAAAAAADQHKTVVLALMSDGVDWFAKKESNVETVVQGEPFKPCKAMLDTFLKRNGLVLACTTCVKHRGLSFETDVLECVKPLQMPDLIRMLGEAKSLQFT